MVTRTSTGTYRVRFERIAALYLNEINHGGVVHVVPYTTSPYLCTEGAWYVVNASDLDIFVYCFNSTGARQDTRFLVNFVAATNTLSTLEYSYLWANQQTTESYVPPSYWRWDATGGAATVTRNGVGSYQVYLPASADRYPTQAVFQATAYSTSPVYCKTNPPFAFPGFPPTGVINVRCFRYDGSPVDAQFTLSYGVDSLLVLDHGYGWASAYVWVSSDAASVTWQAFSTDPPDYDFSFSVSRSAIGRYVVTTNSPSGTVGLGVAHASSSGNVRCVVSSYAEGLNFQLLAVRCFSATGTPADTSFYVGFQ